MRELGRCPLLVHFLTALLLLATPAAAQTVAPPRDSLKALHWTGSARIFADGRELEIGVDTRVVPFRAALSRSWLLAQGPASERSMTITPQGGVIARGGRCEPMPAAMLEHERQQFAIYGLMQLAARTRASQVGGWAADAPAAVFSFDAEGRVTEARDAVVDPAGGGGAIAQTFRFSDYADVGGMAWPRRIEILQADKPYMILQIAKVELDSGPAIAPPCELTSTL